MFVCQLHCTKEIIMVFYFYTILWALSANVNTECRAPSRRPANANTECRAHSRRLAIENTECRAPSRRPANTPPLPSSA